MEMLRNAKYCDEHMCVCVCVFCLCLSVRVSPEPHARSLPNFLCMLPMAVAQSSSGVVAIRYVFPVFSITDIMFLLYNGPYSSMNIAMKDQFRLNSRIYCKVG